jgi:hypothetical protein
MGIGGRGYFPQGKETEASKLTSNLPPFAEVKNDGATSNLP